MYRVGTYYWGKRHPSHRTFFSCDAASLRLPPAGYLSGPMGTQRIHPGRKEPQVVTGEFAVRQGYAMCAILRAMNEAQASYKGRYCRPEEVSGGVRRFTDLKPDALAADPYA